MTLAIITAIVGIITILAIILSPLIALKVQKKIEIFNEQQSRKLDIFKTLLATRANTVSFEHVKALNMIDIEFYDHKDIRESWNMYRDHLNSQYPSNENKPAQERWEEKRIDYFTDLLYEMSKFFGYEFDRVILKKGAYNPVAHGILDLEQRLIRQGFVNLLLGNTAVKVELIEQKPQSTVTAKQD